MEQAAVACHGETVAYWSSVVCAWAFVLECTVEGHQWEASCAVEHHPHGVPLNVVDDQ